MQWRAAILGLGSLTLAILSTGCSDECENTQVFSRQSPDGRHMAILFERSCGATSGFTTQISIVGEGQHQAAGAGNIFSADTDHGRAASAPWGGPFASVRWVTGRHLIVTYDAAARILTSRTRLGEITIDHEPADPGR